MNNIMRFPKKKEGSDWYTNRLEPEYEEDEHQAVLNFRKLHLHKAEYIGDKCTWTHFEDEDTCQHCSGTGFLTSVCAECYTDHGFAKRHRR